MNNGGYTSLISRNSNGGYTVLFSSSKGGESAGTIAFGPNGTSIAYSGESAGTVASSYTGSSTTCGCSCGSFTAIG